MMPSGSDGRIPVDIDRGVSRPVVLFGQGGPAEATVIGWDLLRGSTVFDGAGEAVIDFGSPPFDGWWMLERLWIRSDSALASSLTLYVGEANNANGVDETGSGNGDVSEYPRGLYVAGGSPLRAVWTGGTVGARVWATAQVALMRAV